MNKDKELNDEVFSEYKITIEGLKECEGTQTIQDITRGVVLGMNGDKSKSAIFGAWSEENMVTSILYLLNVLSNVCKDELKGKRKFQVLNNPDLLKYIICEFIDDEWDFLDEDCQTINVDVNGLLKQVLDEFLKDDDDNT